MARTPKSSLPTLRHHRASGQGVVTLGGRVRYLGPFGTDECRQRYNAELADWLSGGTEKVGLAAWRSQPSLVEVIARYMSYCEGRYAGQSATLHNIRRA